MENGVGAPLADSLRSAPILAEPDAAAAKLDDWLAGLDAASPLRIAGSRGAVRALLLGVADHSPFLWRLATGDADRCARLLNTAPETALDMAIVRMADEAGSTTSVEDLKRIVRHARNEIALLVALADLGGVWAVDRVVEALTRFADEAVRIVIAFLIREAERSGKLRPAVAGAAPEDGCGLVVLALGKLGAGELNYSSDIDLVAFFDPAAPRLAEGVVAPQFYVRLIQNFVRILQERTADGYVLRVDLRLRPDPASTAVAIGLPSAFSYYESYGQNWERAAFIKARPVGGDLALGERFLADLAPFIWRKYFDYAAIADIHAMKRQIHMARGHQRIAVAGHDVKLGRGGIREIEFFVQTQQLIFGGRRAQLRGRRTLAMLAALQEDGWIDAKAVTDLADAYQFLRAIEHRLQMTADEQTQRLPADEAALERFARFASFANAAAFGETLTVHLANVERHYARLFENAPDLGAETGSLVFTGTTSDPETLVTLRTMGFMRPEDASETIRGWHFGRRAAVQSPRAREILTDLVPALLAAFSESADPDGALATMDTMLGRMPAAVELFSLLRSNEALLRLFADVLGSAPRLAGTIATRSHVLDVAIDPAAAGADRHAGFERRLAAALQAARTQEEFLDQLRDLAQEELFQIGIRLLSATDSPGQAGEAYAGVADAIIRAALDRCMADFAAEHGLIDGGACVVVGMGKLGSREMTATSDLDLIVIYRADPAGGDSDGRRPLDGGRYYTRLTQRLIAALTVPTRRGRLYEVDVRLRPSGRQGPLATRFTSFVQYQRDEARTWEHMALTRARVVAGDAVLAADVTTAIRDTLTRSREAEALKHDVAAMRALIAVEKGNGGFWDPKLPPGGLLDIEFIAQHLGLRFGATHPDVLQRRPPDIIAACERLALIEADEAVALRAAYDLQTGVAQMIRLAVEGTFDPARAGIGFIRRLVAVATEPDLSALESAITDARTAVRAIFRQRIGEP